MSKFLLQGGRSQEYSGQSHLYEVFANKTILYIPYANEDYEKGFRRFKEYIPKTAKVILALFSDLERKSELIAKIEVVDVFFVAGGCYNKLHKIWCYYNLDAIFRPYLNKDIIFAGVSAGAILWSSYGVTDSSVFMDNGSYYNFKISSGLGYVNILFCPHYDKPELVIIDDLAKNYPCDAYLLEDDTAIFIQDGRIDVFKDRKNKAIYELKRDNNYILTPLYERN